MEETERKPIRAVWNLELLCECPKCGKYVDLLTAADFWDGRQLQVLECDTELSDALDVWCPACLEEFDVRCVW